MHNVKGLFFNEQIQGNQDNTAKTKQIHIAYHNGDHYSSVRKINDNTESPASIQVKVSNVVSNVNFSTVCFVKLR
jgi:hypothetical protein